jgi:2-polyprenyl-6-methoxyphenol hydroxylase-like FAD-dependent oxidoreductase
MKPKRETDVVVVGAGPVGLCAALGLAERGIGVEIVDRDWIGSAHSYALALHPGTLELLEESGVAHQLLEEGRRIERIELYEGQVRMASLELARLGGRYPFALVLPQSKLERDLEGALAARGVKVLWNHQVLGLEDRGEQVEVELGRMDRVSLGYPVARTEWVIDKRFRTAARYVVGADGYDSFTRRHLGARYEELGGAQSFSVWEFQSAAPLPEEMRLVFHEGTTSVLWPMRDGRGRWSFEIARDRAQDRQRPPDLAELVRSRAPWFAPVPREVYWSTTTHFERRLAEPFGRGRIWLAGDAAHVTSPVGAQSMNVGLREASELAARLAAILEGRGSAELLGQYDAERRAEWRTLLGVEGELRAVAGGSEWARASGPRLVSCLPTSGSSLAGLLRQVGLELA